MMNQSGGWIWKLIGKSDIPRTIWGIISQSFFPTNMLDFYVMDHERSSYRKNANKI